MQTSSTPGPALAVPGPEELPAGLVVTACCVAGLVQPAMVQPAMARMRVVPNKDVRRMVPPSTYSGDRALRSDRSEDDTKSR